MLKKLLIVCLFVVVSTAVAGESSVAVATQSFFGPELGFQTPSGNGRLGIAPLNTYAGGFFGWLVCNHNTPAKTAVTALLTYCIAYTLYQTARGVGSTVWTWWKGEQLSPLMQRQVEVYMAELIKRNGMGQMAIRRSPHHEGDTCTCGDCCEARRVRK